MKTPRTIAEATGDNRLWTVEQMLERALEHLRSGEEKADAALLILVEDREDGAFTTHTYRANLQRDREIALLSAKHLACVRDWIYGDL